MITRRATLTFLGAAAMLSFPASLTRAESPKRFRIGYQKSSTILVIARRQEEVEKRLAPLGVDTVEWVEFQFGPPLLEALGSGAIDVGLVGDTPPIFAQAAGAPLVYVASAPSTFCGVLVPQASPVASVADLKGKRIAMAKGSSAHNFTVQALKLAGLEFDTIEPSYLAPADAVAAFAGGSVDAWTVWDPYLAMGEQRHSGRTIVSTASDPLLESNSFYLANRKFADAHGEVLDAALSGFAEATRWGAAHPDEMATIAAEATGVEKSAQVVAIGRYRIAMHAITPETLARQQRIADALLALQLIPKSIDVAAYAWNETPRI